jgi:hypothetical protein
MPVRVRRATQHAAMFSVAADAAQRMIDHSGLRICEYLPGRGIVTLLLMRYVDSDLGAYHEYGTCVMVNPPGSSAQGLKALGDAVAFVHHLPVDQEFTCEAGQVIWGFPKVMADFTMRAGDRQCGFDVGIGGRLIVGIDFRDGLCIPARFTAEPRVLRTYSHRDGVTREIGWELRLSGLRGRAGGAQLRLGDHPYADELRTLGLPKRALVAQSAANVEMTFGDAHEIWNTGIPPI